MKYYLLIIILSIYSCSDSLPDRKLFVEKTSSGIHFSNDLTYSEEFNPYLYRNFYNGGGVSCGDINNDGLIDVFFTGNQVENKMYLNLGDWNFKDITKDAGVGCPDVWCTGSNMVDINDDGLLDIYVCKGGDPKGPKRHNELFINNGDLTFTERSKEYGLDIKGLSIQSAFFDFDRDGDLDCYLLNNSTKPIGGGLDLKKTSRSKESEDGNKLLRNDNGHFIDVASEVGIYNSDIGFGLGITISDFNLDMWPDIFISNDFFEKDYLYINQKDGTFAEQAEEYMQSMSMGSMGADAADLDNDLAPDLMVTEMLPNGLRRQKTKSVYETWNKYKLSVKQGYYHQFPRNALHRNLGGKGFSEISRLAGVDATDWSWSCLMQDYDNNSYKDILITNGIYKDLLDRDYLTFIADKNRVASMIKQGGKVITELIDSMPSSPVSNHVYANSGNLTFEDVSKKWGLDKKGYSNGSAYADLDNDGDLDLVINNVNAKAGIYENHSTDFNHNSFIDIELKGKPGNIKAIGTKVIVHCSDHTIVQELYPSRGFQSSVPYRLHFGLGQTYDQVDSINIYWPDGYVEQYLGVSKDSLLQLSYGQGKPIRPKESISKSNVEIDTVLVFEEKDRFNQFDRNKLLHRMNPKLSPVIKRYPDFKNMLFIGGAKFQDFIILDYRNKIIANRTIVRELRNSEVTDILFLDIDNDGDNDAYIACGGSSFSKSSPELADVILHNVDGEFIPSKIEIKNVQNISTSAALSYDWNKDGYMDIIISDSRYNLPYGEAGSIYILVNKGGQGFEQVTIPILSDLGMITDMEIGDLDADGIIELVVVGEWMNVKVFSLGEEITESTEHFGLNGTMGLWTHVNILDLEDDKFPDVFLGNCGLNSGLDNNSVLVIADFDSNGRKDNILCHQSDSDLIPVLDKDDLVSTFPGLNKKYLSYEKYSTATITDLFGSNTLANAKILRLDTTATLLYQNIEGKLSQSDLPTEIQYSSVFCSSFVRESDGDKQLMIGGNHYQIKPQFGREDASELWSLDLGNSIGDNFLDASVKNLNIRGEIRSIDSDNLSSFVSLSDGTILNVVYND